MPSRAIVTLKSMSPASQCRPISDKKANETYDEHEERCWRERLHCDDQGQVMFSQFALMNCVRDASSFLGEKIPGGRGATYKKHFEAGLIVLDDMKLFDYEGKPILNSEVVGRSRFVPSDGKPGGGSRVRKVFPFILNWQGKAEFQILAPAISERVFRHHLEQAGIFIGLGSFRVRNRGIFGRFEVKEFKWRDE